MLDPTCERCGGTLRAVPAGELDDARLEDADVRPAAARGDGMSVLALVIVLPWVLPMLGIELADVAFAVPLVLLTFAAARMAQLASTDAVWRPVLLALAVTCVAGAAGSAVAVVSAFAGEVSSDLAYYVGAVGSAALVFAGAILARRTFAACGWSRMVDAGQASMVVVALGVWFLILPGFRDGDPVLTAIVAADLAALVLFGLSALARRTGEPATVRPAEWWLLATGATVTAGDALALAGSPVLVAALWGVAGFCLAVAGDHGLAAERPLRPRGDHSGRRFVLHRVVAPLACVVTPPATALVLAGAHRDGLDAFGAVYFAAFTLAALGLAFGRQAHLLAEHERAARRERRLREEATRRSNELEALTGLATTMTQTLEEAPIVEQALGVLHTAARATSAALHLHTPEGARVAAAAGEWYAERSWAPARLVDAPEVTRRGRREILRLPLAARGHDLGTVTLVRAAEHPFDEHGVDLLRLLVDQMAVAVQNARDYREKLEQAIRDPLTGLYNRRFLLEALEKEVQRVERYGSEASFVLFDVDDFKAVNDSLGHAAGDEVLREIGAVAQAVIRPTDSFARIGGEEFALLLPETSQLEALLVAERVRAAIARRPILADRRVTVSGGLASCPADAADADELQRLADGALYWAKRNGKDLCAVASDVTVLTAPPVQETMLRHLYALVALLDGEDEGVRERSDEVARCATALAERLRLEPARVSQLRRAGSLHVLGEVVLARAGFADEARWVGLAEDGPASSGDVPIEARILAVANAYADGRPVAGLDRAVVEALDELTAEGRLVRVASGRAG
jgi:diguanylate cyclase (GGDEF)-like protein